MTIISSEITASVCLACDAAKPDAKKGKKVLIRRVTGSTLGLVGCIFRRSISLVIEQKSLGKGYLGCVFSNLCYGKIPSLGNIYADIN